MVVKIVLNLDFNLEMVDLFIFSYKHASSCKVKVYSAIKESCRFALIIN